MELLKNCPACQSGSIKSFLKSRDYFLSNEEFLVEECNECGLRYTNPRPGFSEILKYYDSADYISHDSSRKGVLTWIYTHARNYMLNKKFNIVSAGSKGKRILDIGCGTGEFLNFCKSRGFESYGVELNEKPREAAIQEYGLDIRKSLNDYLLEDAKFDCITLWHVLEHIHDLENTMHMVKHLLKPEGTLIIALPNSSSWDAVHYGQFWAAYDLPRHLYHFNKSSFAKFAGIHKLKIIKILPQVLDSFYISLLSEKYRTGKNNFLKAFLYGAMSNFHAWKQGNAYSSLIYILHA
ncbi:MAG: class I SAM-dependent methyltransferase [Bacteroidota bacterium]|jgi:2-polyprenyl-3-methyl-5-hydroxy-6-metoxy-1,4-benzoquinol methylase